MRRACPALIKSSDSTDIDCTDTEGTAESSPYTPPTRRGGFKMPRRVSETDKYKVIMAVLDHCSPRVQARWRAVSKAFHTSVPASITKPTYADILEDIAKFTKIKDMSTLSCYGTDGSELVISKVDKKIVVELVGLGGPELVSRCKPNNLKFIMYRALEKKKTIRKYGPLEQVLDKMESDSLVVMC